MIKNIDLPLNDDVIKQLKCGDRVLLNGNIITARDMAHKRFCDALSRGEKLPISLENETIYYVGATPPRPGNICGSAGPTSSKRMDPFTPTLLDLGVKGMIGKGARNIETIDAIKRNGCVYFCAVGGAGALISKSIVEVEPLCYEDLGTEGVYRYTLKDFPCIVAIDCQGNSLL